MKKIIAGIVVVLMLASCSDKAPEKKPSSNLKAPSPELMGAINRGDYDAIAQLLSVENPNNGKLVNLEQPLSNAINRGDVRIVELLLQNNASPNPGMNSTSPLVAVGISGASTGRKILILRKLVAAGVDINQIHLGRGLMESLVGNVYNLPVIEEAIRLGGDPTVKDSQGRTPIDRAIEMNLPEATIQAMKNYKELRGKEMPKFGNTEGMCKVLGVNDEKDPEGLAGLYFNHNAPCAKGDLADGVNGIFTKYDGTECRGFKNGYAKKVQCKAGY